MRYDRVAVIEALRKALIYEAGKTTQEKPNAEILMSMSHLQEMEPTKWLKRGSHKKRETFYAMVH